MDSKGHDLWRGLVRVAPENRTDMITGEQLCGEPLRFGFGVGDAGKVHKKGTHGGEPCAIGVLNLHQPS